MTPVPPAVCKAGTDNAPEKKATSGERAGNRINMNGSTLEVVSESLITSYHSKTGKPYQFIACSVRDVMDRRGG